MIASMKKEAIWSTILLAHSLSNNSVLLLGRWINETSKAFYRTPYLLTITLGDSIIELSFLCLHKVFSFMWNQFLKLKMLWCYIFLSNICFLFLNDLIFLINWYYPSPLYRIPCLKSVLSPNHFPSVLLLKFGSFIVLFPPLCHPLTNNCFFPFFSHLFPYHIIPPRLLPESPNYFQYLGFSLSPAKIVPSDYFFWNIVPLWHFPATRPSFALFFFLLCL